MNKIILIIISSLSIINLSYGQHSFACENSISSEITDESNLKSTGDTIFYEDFSSGSIPENWLIVDNTGNDYVWICTDQAPGGDFSGNVGPLESNSGGYFMSLPSDYYNSPMPAQPVELDSYFQTGPIDCSGRNTVIIRVIQRMKWCCMLNDPHKLWISNDNTSWTEYSMTQNQTPSGPLPTHTLEYDISNLAANEEAVYIKFHQLNASHYFWMIDDILLYDGIIDNIEDTHEKGIEGGFTINPNPAIDFVNVHITDAYSEVYTISLITMQGQLISKIKVNDIKPIIDLSRLAYGSYIMKITDSNERLIGTKILHKN